MEGMERMDGIEVGILGQEDVLEEPEGLLVVRNLARRVTADKLRELFESHGEVIDVHIPRNKVTKCNRDFAFVKMARVSEAEEARNELDGAVVNKQEIEVVLGHERRAPA